MAATPSALTARRDVGRRSATQKPKAVRLHIFPGLLFIAAAIADVVFLILGRGDLHFWVKPALMPLLLVTALLAMGENRTGRLRPIPLLLTLALLFHTGGDVFLLWPGTGFFIAGLASFLVGHFFYVAIMSRGLKGLTLTESLIGIGLPLVLGPAIAHLFSLEVPMYVAVSVYAFTLLMYPFLGIVGLMQRKREYRFFIWGGLFFICSDSILALNEFLGIDFPLRGAAVMFTYILAEVLLVLGATKVTPALRS